MKVYICDLCGKLFYNIFLVHDKRLDLCSKCYKKEEYKTLSDEEISRKKSNIKNLWSQFISMD